MAKCSKCFHDRRVLWSNGVCNKCQPSPPNTRHELGKIRKELSDTRQKANIAKQFIGRVFGRLTVVSTVTRYRFDCRCECGQSVKVLRALLESGRTTNCGCLAKNAENGVFTGPRMTADELKHHLEERYLWEIVLVQLKEHHVAWAEVADPESLGASARSTRIGPGRAAVFSALRSAGCTLHEIASWWGLDHSTISGVSNAVRIRNRQKKQPTWGIAAAVLAAFADGQQKTVVDVATIVPQTSIDVLRTTLSKLTKRGKLLRVGLGLYALAPEVSNEVFPGH